MIDLMIEPRVIRCGERAAEVPSAGFPFRLRFGQLVAKLARSLPANATREIDNGTLRSGNCHHISLGNTSPPCSKATTMLIQMLAFVQNAVAAAP